MIQSAREQVNKILVETTECPVKKRFFLILNDKNYSKSKMETKKQSFLIKRFDIVILNDERRAKVMKNASNSNIQVQLFDSEGKFTDEIIVITKSDINRVENEPKSN